MIAAYLAAQPADRRHGRGGARARAADPRSEPPRAWPELLPALRARSGTTRATLVKRLAAALGHPGGARRRSRSTCTGSRPAQLARGAGAPAGGDGARADPRRARVAARARPAGGSRPAAEPAAMPRFARGAASPTPPRAVGRRVRRPRARSPRSTTSSPAPMDEVAAARAALDRFTDTYGRDRAAGRRRGAGRQPVPPAGPRGDDLCADRRRRAGDVTLSGVLLPATVGDLGAPRRAARRGAGSRSPTRSATTCSTPTARRCCAGRRTSTRPTRRRARRASARPTASPPSS